MIAGNMDFTDSDYDFAVMSHLRIVRNGQLNDNWQASLSSIADLLGRTVSQVSARRKQRGIAWLFAEDEWYPRVILSKGKLGVTELGEMSQRRRDIEQTVTAAHPCVRVIHAADLMNLLATVATSVELNGQDLLQFVLGGEVNGGLYDCPKFVFAVIQMRREANAGAAIPHLRLDSDVEPSAAALDQLLSEWQHLDHRQLGIIAGSYGSASALNAIRTANLLELTAVDVLNATSLRTAHLAAVEPVTRQIMQRISSHANIPPRDTDMAASLLSDDTLRDDLEQRLPSMLAISTAAEPRFVDHAAAFLRNYSQLGIDPLTMPTSGAFFAATNSFWHFPPRSNQRSNVSFIDDHLAIRTRTAAGQACDVRRFDSAVVSQRRHGESGPTVADIRWHLTTYTLANLLGVGMNAALQVSAYRDALHQQNVASNLAAAIWPAIHASMRSYVEFARQFRGTFLAMSVVGRRHADYALYQKLGFFNEMAPCGLAEAVESLPHIVEALANERFFPKGSLADFLRILVNDLLVYVSPKYRRFWNEIRATTLAGHTRSTYRKAP